MITSSVSGCKSKKWLETKKIQQVAEQKHNNCYIVQDRQVRTALQSCRV